MSHRLICAVSTAAITLLATANTDARSHHTRVAAHHHHYHGGPASYQGYAGYRYIAPVDPRYGYEEAPYDPSYQGPGAEVFALTRKAQHEPGVTLELEPDAKETATGGPVGGVPGRDGT